MLIVASLFKTTSKQIKKKKYHQLIAVTSEMQLNKKQADK